MTRPARSVKIALVSAGLLVAAADYANAMEPPPRFPAYGFIGRDGHVIVPPACDNASIPQEGDWVSLSRDGKGGFLNLRTKQTTGLIFNSFVLSDTPLFSQGPEPVSKDGKYGYIDENGKVVIAFKFDNGQRFDKNGFARVGVNGKFGYINLKGKFVISLKYESASNFNNQGFASVKINGLWGAINRKGASVFPAKFNFPLSSINGEFAVTRMADRMGVVDRHGKTIAPFKFAMIRDFGRNGLAAASLDLHGIFAGAQGHWGFINPHGVFEVQPIYTDLTDFTEKNTSSTAVMHAPIGLARAQLTDDKGEESTLYINKAGQAILRLPSGLFGNQIENNGLILVFGSHQAASRFNAPSFGFYDPLRPNDQITWYNLVDNFSNNGLAPVMKDHLWGYINRSGRFIIKPQFLQASGFASDGLALVKIGTLGELGHAAFIDQSGKVTLETPFEDATLFGGSGFSRISMWRLGGQAINLSPDKCAAQTF